MFGVSACSTKGPRLCLRCLACHLPTSAPSPWGDPGRLPSEAPKRSPSEASKLLWLRQPRMCRLRKLWRVSPWRKDRCLIASRGSLSCLFPGWREAFAIDSRLIHAETPRADFRSKIPLIFPGFKKFRAPISSDRVGPPAWACGGCFPPKSPGGWGFCSFPRHSISALFLRLLGFGPCAFKN